jgi:transcriptional regulator with XRE-family HTH domain
MSFINKEIGRRFRSLYSLKSQNDLAILLNVRPATISQWINGKVKVPTERLISAYLKNKHKGITLDWVMGLDLMEKSQSPQPAPTDPGNADPATPIGQSLSEENERLKARIKELEQALEELTPR